MNRSLSVLAVTLFALFTIAPSFAIAQDMPPAEHKSIALGFHNDLAPIGVRWWLAGQKVGVDLGLGYDREPSFIYSNEHLSTFRFDVGIPIVLKSWSRLHFLFRPGLAYESRQVETDPLGIAPFDTDTNKDLLITGELEAEAFLLDNFSVSASHGIGYDSFDPAGGGDKENSFFTLGNNFTNVGFHVYLFGGER
ncbi:MAG TPA: hypothetical protein VE326_11985 [Candidatus Binatia bacterium]|nr:hypothetical protein [Candidatus Binatia bacterium]